MIGFLSSRSYMDRRFQPNIGSKILIQLARLKKELEGHSESFLNFSA